MRSSQRNDFVLTDYARTLIRFKARQLCRLHGFSRSDEEELQQDLWVAVVKQAGNFDPQRSSLDTFIDRVVNTQVAMILRERRRKKRAEGFQASSLDESKPGADCSEPQSAKLTDEDLARRLGIVRVGATERRETAEAVEAALNELPEDLRDVCRRVMEGSILSAARDGQTSRRQVRNALAQARPFFERAGLGVE
ncbi:MAG: hypothetical protein R3E01_14900 [Pirellulaceae bacterium]